MKKFFLALLVIMLPLSLIGCSLTVESNPNGDSSVSVVIDSPEIVLNDDYSVSWSAVDGATEYVVEVNGIEQPAQDELGFAPITEVGTYTIRVKAISSEASSEWSNTVSYTFTEQSLGDAYLAKPVLTLLEGNAIEWEAVDGATGYIASVNGDETEVFTDTYLPAYTKAGTYIIMVKAVGEKEGQWSEEITYVVRQLLTLTEYDEPVSILKTSQRLYIESTTTAEKPKNIYNYTTPGTNVVPFVKLEWRCILGGTVTYTVEISKNEDLSSAKTITTDKNYVNVYNLYNGTTYYYRVTAENDRGTSVSESASFTTDNTAPRVINVEGVPNVRDIGGYMTESGKRTLQGLIFRGAEMDGKYPITEAGRQTMLEELGIKADVDLRGNTGITESPLGKDVEITFYPIGNYLSAFSTNGQTELYRQIFSYLADANNYPVYIHCQGGADRTGTVVFLLNALVGVPLENLIEDQEFTSFSQVGMRLFYPSEGGSETLLMSPVYDKLMADYAGESLSEKVANYMLSIGVTETEIYNLRAIMLGEELRINVTAPAEVNVAYEPALNLSVPTLGNKEIASVVVGGENVEYTYANGVISVAVDEFSAIADGEVEGKVVFNDGSEIAFNFIKKDIITVKAHSFNIIEDTLLKIEISEIGELTVNKVMLGDAEVEFAYEQGRITVPANELDAITNGAVNGTIVLSNERELAFTFSKIAIETVLLTDYIAKDTKLDATNSSVTSYSSVGYGVKVKGLLKSEGVIASKGGININIGSYGFMLRAKELRVYQNGREIARQLGLDIKSDAFNNGDLYFIMWVEEVSETIARLHFVTKTVDGSESEYEVEYSYDFTVGASDVKSSDAKIGITINTDVTSLTLLDDGGTGAHLPKEYVTVNLTDYIPAGTKLDSAKTTVTSNEVVGYGIKVKMLLKTEDVVASSGKTIISIGSYGFELRNSELRVYRDGKEEGRGLGLKLPSDIFNSGNMIATMWVDIINETTARLTIQTSTLDGSASVYAIELYYDFEIKATDVASENAKVTITIGASYVTSLTVLNEDGSPLEEPPVGDDDGNDGEDGIVYFSDYIPAGSVVAVNEKVSTTVIGFGTKVKMLIDANASGNGGLLFEIGSYGFYHRGSTLRVYRDGAQEARPSGMTLSQRSFNNAELYVTMWVELIDENTARLHFVTETVDGSENENAIAVYYDFAIKGTDITSENAVFSISSLDATQGEVTILEEK